MAEKPAAEKTEQPTPKKISKAKEKGQVAHSAEAASAATLVVLVLMTALLAPSILRWLCTEMTDSMSPGAEVFSGAGSFVSFAKEKLVDFFIVVAPFFLALFAGSILANAAVSGLNFSPGAVSLKFSSINPVTGFQKLVNGRSLVRLCLSVVKLAFIGLIVWFYLADKLDVLARLRWEWSYEILAGIGSIIFGLMVRVCIGIVLIALADVIYQKWKFIQDLKMTRQEVKEERKQTEGSPEVKVRVRKAQFKMAVKRMLRDVPKANVVLVNPTHVAVALKYDAKTMDSPVVVAKGAGYVAEKIRKIAQSYGVPVIRRPELARTIYKTVEIGRAIPEVLYVAVAEVLALIYRLRHRR